MRGLYSILLLILSNTFMTLAWYGHLKFKEMTWSRNLGLVSIILISWGIALFEYCFQVPANRIGFKENGGPFSLVELKVIQEVVTLSYSRYSPLYSSGISISRAITLSASASSCLSSTLFLREHVKTARC